MFDIKADYDKREYRVIDRATGKVAAIYSYTSGECARGIAHGRANIERDARNRPARPDSMRNYALERTGLAKREAP